MRNGLRGSVRKIRNGGRGYSSIRSRFFTRGRVFVGETEPAGTRMARGHSASTSFQIPDGKETGAFSLRRYRRDSAHCAGVADGAVTATGKCDPWRSEAAAGDERDATMQARCLAEQGWSSRRGDGAMRGYE